MSADPRINVPDSPAEAHLLDKPIWNALGTSHAKLAVGNDLARRYPVAIAPFAAVAAFDERCVSALAGIMDPGQAALIVNSVAFPGGKGFDVISRLNILQMIAVAPPMLVDDIRITQLTESDAEAMHRLAMLAKPGPFTVNAQQLGCFWGIHSGGELVAMAGQRLRQPGFIELSGLCTHPAFEKQGLGTALFTHVTSRIVEAGSIPYLHVRVGNTGAIEMYHKLGYEIRRELHLAEIRRLP